MGNVITTGKGANQHVFSVLATIEKCGFFSMPHVQRHETSVFLGTFRGHVTLKHFSGNVTTCI